MFIESVAMATEDDREMIVNCEEQRLRNGDQDRRFYTANGHNWNVVAKIAIQSSTIEIAETVEKIAMMCVEEYSGSFVPGNWGPKRALTQSVNWLLLTEAYGIDWLNDPQLAVTFRMSDDSIGGYWPQSISTLSPRDFGDYMTDCPIPQNISRLAKNVARIANYYLLGADGGNRNLQNKIAGALERLSNQKIEVVLSESCEPTLANKWLGFGDSGACFYGSMSECRDMLESSGVNMITCHVVENGKATPAARMWGNVHQVKNGALDFTYHNLYSSNSIVRMFLSNRNTADGNGVRYSLTTGEVYSPNGDYYMNESSSYKMTIRWGGNDSPNANVGMFYEIGYEPWYECENCGHETQYEDDFLIDEYGHRYCGDCATICAHDGCVYLYSDMVCADYDGIWYHANYVTNCDHCGSSFLDNDSRMTEDGYVCPDCYHDSYSCEICGAVTHETNLSRLECDRFPDGVDLCQGCYDRESETPA